MPPRARVIARVACRRVEWVEAIEPFGLEKLVKRINDARNRRARAHEPPSCQPDRVGDGPGLAPVDQLVHVPQVDGLPPEPYFVHGRRLDLLGVAAPRRIEAVAEWLAGT